MPEMQSDNFPEIWCTIFYESKLKLIRFVMMVYFFTKRNRTNAQTNNNGSILQDNKYSFYYLIYICHIVKNTRLILKIITATEAALQ